MPIAQWICAGCGGREVPLSHFAETACGERIHPDFARAILIDRNSQYVQKAVRVSHGLGCPRRAAIEESEPYAVDPLEANAPLTGVAWHALMESAAPANYREVELTGTIAGVKVSGKCDRIRKLSDGATAIEDWKHVNDFNVKHLKAGAKLEHQVQTSIYAELAAQSGWIRPTVGIIWYHGSTGGKDALTPHRFGLMGLDTALAARPYECEYSVQELLKQAASHYVDGVRWQDLPLAGKSIKFGSKTGCDYCGVRSVCWTADKGAPF